MNERENDPPLSKELSTPGRVPPFYKDRNPLLFLSLFVYIFSFSRSLSPLLCLSFSLTWNLGSIRLVLVRKGFFKFFSFFSPPLEFYFEIFGLET